MKIAITGGAGFIGLRIAEMAVEKGHKVTLIDRDKRALDAIREQRRLNKAGYVEADISVADVLVNAFRPCDAVIHTAAIVKEGGVSLEDYRQVNVRGSMSTFTAATQAKVKKFIHISSINVYGFDYEDGITEKGPLNASGNYYCQSKIESEEALLKAATGRGAPGLYIVRPGDVIGPCSKPWVLRPVKMMRKRMFGLPSGGSGILNYVFIDNLVESLFMILNKGSIRQPYNIVDGQVTTREYFDRLANMAGYGKPLSLPAFLLSSSLSLLQAGRFVGLKPIVRPEVIRFLQRKGSVSSDLARKELGDFSVYSLEQALGRIAMSMNKS